MASSGVGGRTIPAGKAGCFRPGRLAQGPKVAVPQRRSRGLRRAIPLSVNASVVEPGSTVLVAGCTGGVGQLITARLLESGYQVKALTRKADVAKQCFGDDEKNLEIIVGDLRDEAEARKAIKGVHAVCCVIGTTAYPSQRWEAGNTAEATNDAVKNLISVTPSDVKRFVLISSQGTTRRNKFPYNMIDMFKVLTHKRMQEETLMASGLPYTIFRPGRLIDGPYTSTDLATLLKTTRGSKKEVKLSSEDIFSGDTSRISLAEAVLQSLNFSDVEGNAYAIENIEGDGPRQDPKAWETRFASAV